MSLRRGRRGRAEGQAPTPHGPVTVDWGHRAAGGEFALHVSALSGTSGEIAVPTFGRPVTIQVNGHQSWDGQRATAPGVRAAGGYIVLSGLPGGSYGNVTRGDLQGTVPPVRLHAGERSSSGD